MVSHIFLRYKLSKLGTTSFLELNEKQMGLNFYLLRFNTHENRRKLISNNRLLNYIALDNNKNLKFHNENVNQIMKLIQKIRSFNQFDDKIIITFTKKLNI